MKYKNYLIRLIDRQCGFDVVRGHELDNDPKLAIIKRDFDGKYVIIDVPTGLSIMGGKVKKDLLERWESSKVDMMKRINQARATEKYPRKVIECNNARETKRREGYEI